MRFDNFVEATFFVDLDRPEPDCNSLIDNMKINSKLIIAGTDFAYYPAGEKHMKAINNKISLKSLVRISVIFAGLLFIGFLALPKVTLAQDNNNPKQEIGVKGFLDEDGDGFNDLLPDKDGDGVPDAIDPDSRGKHADTLSTRQQMIGAADSTDMGRHMRDGDNHHIGMPGDHDPDGHGGMGDMPGMPGGPMPGEPGQYGPGDSTGHDGMHHRDGMGGDGHDGWPPPPPPDSSGMGGHMVRPGSGTSENPSHNSQSEMSISPDQKEINHPGEIGKSIDGSGDQKVKESKVPGSTGDK